MLQEQSIWQELERFNILYNQEVTISNFKQNLSSVVELVEARTHTDKSHANASVLMRHASFIYVSQLYILCKYRIKWSGDNIKIGILDGQVNGRWTPKWVVRDGHWVSIHTEDQVYSAIQSILCQDCGSLINSIAVLTKSSPIVLWENVWGYILWMYVQLLQDTEDLSKQAVHDLELVLNDEIWVESNRKCPFQKFINGQSPQESMASYSRITCCLYYMVPGNEKCTYCPKQSKDKCLQ